MKITNFDEPLGAEVRGIDLREPISESTSAALRAALYDRQALLIRGQGPSLEEQIRLTAVFGQVDEPWDRHHKHPDEPRVQLISNAGRKGIKFKTSTLYWHTDQSFTPRPSRETLLRATAIPPTGGNTMFVNMREAYEGLSAELKTKVAGYRARHSFAFLMKDLMARRISQTAAATDGDRFPDVIHPLVRTHPVTGRRALYLNELCVDRIVELEASESSQLLEHLYQHVLQEKYIYRHKWMVGDLLVWDNTSLMHRAEDIPEEPPRLFHRTNTIGQEPF